MGPIKWLQGVPEPWLLWSRLLQKNFFQRPRWYNVIQVNLLHGVVYFRRILQQFTIIYSNNLGLRKGLKEQIKPSWKGLPSLRKIQNAIYLYHPLPQENGDWRGPKHNKYSEDCRSTNLLVAIWSICKWAKEIKSISWGYLPHKAISLKPGRWWCYKGWTARKTLAQLSQTCS